MCAGSTHFDVYHGSFQVYSHFDVHLGCIHSLIFSFTMDVCFFQVYSQFDVHHGCVFLSGVFTV